MKLTIKNKKENKALKRIEVDAEISFENATPKRKDVQLQLAKEAKSDEKLTIIRHIHTRFGDNSAKVTAHIYLDADTMGKIERKNLIEKHVGQKAEAAEEKKEEAAPVKEEPKTEEVKSEEPVTDKPEAN